MARLEGQWDVAWAAAQSGPSLDAAHDIDNSPFVLVTPPCIGRFNCFCGHEQRLTEEVEGPLNVEDLQVDFDTNPGGIDDFDEDDLIISVAQ